MLDLRGRVLAYESKQSIADTGLAKEKPIGFYHTGPRLRSSDLEITELFKRFCPRPVMVIVDVRASGGRGDTGIPTDAYFAVEEIRDVSQASASH